MIKYIESQDLDNVSESDEEESEAEDHQHGDEADEQVDEQQGNGEDIAEPVHPGQVQVRVDVSSMMNMLILGTALMAARR